MRIDGSRSRTRSWWLWGAGLALLGLTGCPGTLHDKERFLTDAAPSGEGDADAGEDPGACGDVVTRIFVPSCGGTGCHGAMAPQQGLDLVSPGVAARVVGVSGTGCTGTLAAPADPANSLLYTKLATSPSCGAQMPLARPPLSSADAACILAWIAGQ
jgi:hypothetical protein